MMILSRSWPTAVSLASRELRGEGQRILFRTMALIEDKAAHIKFLTVIISSSLLAQHVEEFHQFGLIALERQQEPLWDLTCRGLNAMLNLKHLFFGIERWSFRHNFAWVYLSTENPPMGGLPRCRTTFGVTPLVFVLDFKYFTGINER